MKIGILGGSFNPIHLGHLILAEEVREKLRLDRILFVPTNIPPHKVSKEIAGGRFRLAMVRSAIKGNKNFAVSDIEIKRGGKSYTIDTLKALKELYPKDKLIFIIGSDLVDFLDNWKDFDTLTRLVEFAVATRPGFPLEDISSFIDSRRCQAATIPIRAVDISAFEVRSRIKKRQSFRYLVPESVFAYINKHKLYRK